MNAGYFRIARHPEVTPMCVVKCSLSADRNGVQWSAWGSAGMIFIPLTGWFADIWSIQWAFAGLIVFPVLGFLLGLKLPRELST